VVLALGALHHKKGFDILLAALAQIPADVDWRCWIAGDGPDREALAARAQAPELAGRVQLLGARTDTADLLHAADVLVMPSLSEGLGNAAIEAMACGLPVVASEVGGLRFAVDDGHTGLLVPPASPEALAAALKRVLLDPDLRAKFGASGRERARTCFAADTMVDAYVALYHKLLYITS
jgi:glycosyltransferase involved in cell wall biosynthesis